MPKAFFASTVILLTTAVACAIICELMAIGKDRMEYCRLKSFKPMKDSWQGPTFVLLQSLLLFCSRQQTCSYLLHHLLCQVVSSLVFLDSHVLRHPVDNEADLLVSLRECFEQRTACKVGGAGWERARVDWVSGCCHCCQQG